MKRGFTLIELLVVIAVIGMLASIVLVSLSGTRGKASMAQKQQFASQVSHSLGAYSVGSWAFDNCTTEGAVPPGGTTNDASGYGNTGTVSGAICTQDTPYSTIGSGQGKWALKFGGVGSNNAVALGNKSILNPSIFTIAAWIKPGNISGSYNYIYSNARNCCGAYNGIDFRIAGNRLLGTIWNSSSYALTGNSTIANNSGWHFVAFTYSSPSIKLYLDGKVDKSTSTTVGVGSPASYGSYIGRMGYGAYYALDGVLDDVNVFTEALSIGQIHQLYVEGMGKHLVFE